MSNSETDKDYTMPMLLRDFANATQKAWNFMRLTCGDSRELKPHTPSTDGHEHSGIQSEVDQRISKKPLHPASSKISKSNPFTANYI